MNQIPPDTRRIQSLLTSLIILSILIMVVVLAIAAYPSLIRPILAPSTPAAAMLRPTLTSRPSPTITLTPTQTSTPRATFTPSITPTPTETLVPSLTPTPPGPSTLTPARPVQGDPYKLATWTPELADQAVALMEDLPNTLSRPLRGEDDSAYYKAYAYAVTAASEALLRFPDAPQAARWRWLLSYNLARVGDPLAGEAYAGQIVQALNQGETDLNNLSDWFQTGEPRMTLDLVPLRPPSGYVGSYLLEARSPGGSAFIWLLETPGAYQAMALSSNFDFTNPPEMRAIISDLTGDGIEEVVLYNTAPQAATLQKPRIFYLSEENAKEIGFQSSEKAFVLGTDYSNYWRVVKNDQGGNDLQFEAQVYPACPVTISRRYRWDGSAFQLVDQSFQVEPNPATISLCRYLVDLASDTWGPAAALQVIEPLLPAWPPAQDESDKPFPADARDEWRYRQGIYAALQGDAEKALSIMKDLIANPTVANSSWVEPASQFVTTYRQPKDLYTACVRASFCDPNQAVEYLINQLQADSSQDPVEFLWQAGAQLRSSGYFDFDNDGVKERWFTLKHQPLQKPDLWILADSPEGVRALYVGPLESGQVAPQIINPNEQIPVTWLDVDYFFSLLRDPETRLPYLEWVTPEKQYPNRFKIGLEKARTALFSGEDPADVLKMLQDLEKSPGLLCKANWSCDEYLYLLGLTHEILGNKRAAIDAYLRLWWDYSVSPFTTLARLKLIGTIIPPTGTPTLTPTITPTFFGTPTPSTPMPTFAPTPTLPGEYPYPEPTDSYP